MALAISIAAAITVAVTAKLMHLIFLSGKTISNASLTGRLLAKTEAARQAFVAGWRAQNWRYLLITYPCLLVTMGAVSLLLYWMMPALGNHQSFADMFRYCLMVFGVGVSASLVLSLILVLLVYFVVTLLGTRWKPDLDLRDKEDGKER